MILLLSTMLLFCDERRKMPCTCMLSGVERGIQSTDRAQANSFLKPNSYSESISRSRMRNRNCPFLNCIISRDDFWLMNKANLRLRNSKKGITPVIATIILIAGTLVLALVVGAYTFGLFGSNVKTVELQSATLYVQGGKTGGGVTENTTLNIALTNPGSSTTITALSVSGGAISGQFASWAFHVAGVGPATSTLTSGVNLVTASNSTAIIPGIGGSLTAGQTYNYVITFANGQSISGSIIAQ